MVNVSEGMSLTININQMNPLKKAAPFIAVANAPLLLLQWLSSRHPGQKLEGSMSMDMEAVPSLVQALHIVTTLPTPQR